jgi:Early nodulin 93 ENOD93 protein
MGFTAEVQETCVKTATIEGFKAAGVALALSSAAILGAVRFSPGFAKSLSVSAKTALIVSLIWVLFITERILVFLSRHSLWPLFAFNY